MQATSPSGLPVGAPSSADLVESPPPVTLRDIGGALRGKWPALIAVSIAAGIAGYGIALLIPPTFTARTSFISPQ